MDDNFFFLAKEVVSVFENTLRGQLDCNDCRKQAQNFHIQSSNAEKQHQQRKK